LGEGPLLGHGAEHLELAEVHVVARPIPDSDARPPAIARTRYSRAASPREPGPILHMRGRDQEARAAGRWTGRPQSEAAPQRGGALARGVSGGVANARLAMR